MLKFLIISLSVAFAATSASASMNQKAEAKVLTPKRAVQELSQILFGDASLEGSNKNGNCKISLMTFGVAFQGIAILIEDHDNKQVEFRIESPDDLILRYEEEYNTRYILTRDFDRSKSELLVQWFDDVADMRVTIYYDNDPQPRAVCMYEE